MKSLLAAFLIIASLGTGCKIASFRSVDSGDTTNSNNGSGDSTAGDNGLIVKVPVASLEAGGKTTQATSELTDGTKNPDTNWSVTADNGKDPGHIDADGTYHSPDTASETYRVKITGRLKSDPSKTGTVPLDITPPGSDIGLIATLPVTELPIGKMMTTATAKLKDGTLNPPVTWSVTGPTGQADVGTIDPKTGVYTSPQTSASPFMVIITATLVANPSIKASVPLNITIGNKNLMLTVTLPSPEIKVGGNKMQAVATLSDGTVNPPVIWSVMGPTGKDPGSIDQSGIYTSPAVGNETYPVVITATLIADNTIKGSASLNILPSDMIFARCTKGNQVFPIVADVFQLPANTEKLPTDWKTQKYVETVCMDQYNVAAREFSVGFPDVPSLFEWFGLNTRTTLIAPVEGDYQLKLDSDDGSKLWLDGNLVINNDGQHQNEAEAAASMNKTTNVITATVHLTKGDHNLVLDYFQGPRYRIALQLYWKVPGTSSLVIVPKTAFK